MEKAFNIDAACSSVAGNRSNNEDNFYFDGRKLTKQNSGMKKLISLSKTTEKPVALAVFDGMGGALYGEEAAYAAATAFEDGVKELEKLVVDEKMLLAEICNNANRKIKSFAQRQQISQIGTTMVSLLFSDQEVFVCNVGDSKAFLLRNKKLLQISKDHTDEVFLKSIGVQKKATLLQYLGISSEEGGLDPYISKGQIMRGDRYVICSDGVTDCLNINDLYADIRDSDDPEEIVNRIIRQVKLANGQDNATIISAIVS